MPQFRASLLALLASPLAACEMGTSALPVATFPSPTSTEYTVTATLFADKIGLVQICGSLVLTLPAQCAGGIDLRGIDIRTIPGWQRQRDGTAIASSVKVVGTWDGHAITATRPPQVVDPKSVLWRPEYCDQTGVGGTDPVQDRLNKDFQILKSRGIYIMSNMPCVDGVQVMVAIADPATVTYLTTTYGVRHVVGWFQPVTAQPAPIGSGP
jgi:hypothetical protein